MKIKITSNKNIKKDGLIFMNFIESLKSEEQYKKLQMVRPDMVKKYEDISINELTNRLRKKAYIEMCRCT